MYMRFGYRDYEDLVTHLLTMATCSKSQNSREFQKKNDPMLNVICLGTQNVTSVFSCYIQASTNGLTYKSSSSYARNPVSGS
jgi:hypothetical protein